MIELKKRRKNFVVIERLPNYLFAFFPHLFVLLVVGAAAVAALVVIVAVSIAVVVVVVYIACHIWHAAAVGIWFSLFSDTFCC